MLFCLGLMRLSLTQFLHLNMDVICWEEALELLVAEPPLTSCGKRWSAQLSIF